MNKKRKIRILKDFVDRFNICFENGICESFAIYFQRFHSEHRDYYSYRYKLMSIGDYLEMKEFLSNYLPPKKKNSEYCWRKGLKQPRIEFLEQLKTKYENEKTKNISKT